MMNDNNTAIKQEISILAGNSRVSRDDNSDTITVQPQIAAFRAALIRASEIRKETNKLPAISVAIDHRGIFRKQFLIEGLTNSQKRNPRLSQLHHKITDAFQGVASEIGIPLSAIAAIHEDSARSHASHIIQSGDIPRALTRLMKVSEDFDEDDDVHSAESCGIGARDVDRVTCAAVTREYFLSSITKDSHSLEVFFENDPWSQVGVYVRGAMLMAELGSLVNVSLYLVDKVTGCVLNGKNSKCLQ